MVSSDFGKLDARRQWIVGLLCATAGAATTPAATPAVAADKNERRFMKCPLIAWSGYRVVQPTMSCKPTQVVKTLAILGGHFLRQQYLFHNEFPNVVCTHYEQHCCHIKQNFFGLRRKKSAAQIVANALQNFVRYLNGAQKTRKPA